MFLKLVHFPQIIEEYLADDVGFHVQVKQVYVLMAVVGTQANEIALVGYYIRQLILFEKSFYGRIFLALAFPRLDGDANILVPVKAEAQHCMRDERRAPIDEITVRPVQ